MFKMSLPRAALILAMAFGQWSPQALAQSESDSADKVDLTADSGEPTTTSATYGDWVLRCVRVAAQQAGQAQKAATPPQKICEVLQTVQVQNQQQPIAQIALGHLPGDSQLHLTVVLPTNIGLPGAVLLSGNGKTGDEEKGKQDLQWTRCVAAGCFAEAPVPEENVAIWRAEKQGQIRFQDASGRTVGIPVSWTGLGSALDALGKE